MQNILRKVKPANVVIISVVIMVLSNVGNSFQPRGYINRGFVFDIGFFLGAFFAALFIAFVIELILASRRKD